VSPVNGRKIIVDVGLFEIIRGEMFNNRILYLFCLYAFIFKISWGELGLSVRMFDLIRKRSI